MRILVFRFMAAFGVVALVLTIVGVYDVIANRVQQRRQEFGVRRALDAGRWKTELGRCCTATNRSK